MSGTPGFVTAALATALLLQLGAAWAKVQAVIVEWGEIQAVSGEKLGPDYQEQSLGEGRKLLASRYVNHHTEIAAQLLPAFRGDGMACGGGGRSDAEPHHRAPPPPLADPAGRR